MGQASSSAASTSAIESTGGSVNVNQPNYMIWIVVAVAVVAAIMLYGRKKNA